MPHSVTDDSWTWVAAASRLTGESALSVRVAADRPVCLVRSRGEFHAVPDGCTHGKVAPSADEVKDGTIECWLRGSRFDLTTGRPSTRRTTRRAPTFPVPVPVVVGDVYVRGASQVGAELTP